MTDEAPSELFKVRIQAAEYDRIARHRWWDRYIPVQN